MLQNRNWTVAAVGSFALGAASAYAARHMFTTGKAKKSSDESDPVRDALIEKTKKLDLYFVFQFLVVDAQGFNMIFLLQKK